MKSAHANEHEAWERENYCCTNAFEICESATELREVVRNDDYDDDAQIIPRNWTTLTAKNGGIKSILESRERREGEVDITQLSMPWRAMSTNERGASNTNASTQGADRGHHCLQTGTTSNWFRARCAAVACDEVCTAQGCLCKFHRVAKAVVLKSDPGMEEMRWCHYCKKVQKLSDFTEESGTLCHAKYVLRCQRSKKNRALKHQQKSSKVTSPASGSAGDLQKQPSGDEENSTRSADGRLLNASVVESPTKTTKDLYVANNINNNNNIIDNDMKLIYNFNDLLSPENPFFAVILEESFLKPILNKGNNNRDGRNEEANSNYDHYEFNWNPAVEITNHRLRVDFHPSELMSNNNNSIWNDLRKTGLLSNDDEEFELAQIAPGSTIITWQVFRRTNNNSPMRGQISADRIDTLTENDIARGKPVNDSRSILQNFISYSGFRMRGHQTGIYARKSRENDGSLEVFKTNRAYVEWAEESLVPLVAVIGRPFIVRMGSDFHENGITAVRAYGAFGSFKVSAEDFPSNGIVKFPADTFKSMSSKKMSDGGLFWVQFETANDRCSAPKAALILSDLLTATGAHMALRNLRNENTMRSAIQDIGSVLSLSETGYLYEEEMYDLCHTVIRQCESSPPFQEHAKLLINLLKSIDDDVKSQREEIVGSQQGVTAKRQSDNVNSSNYSHAKCISEAEPYFAFCTNAHEYELSERFDAWYENDSNEFRVANRKGMLGYGVLIYLVAFLVHFFRFCVIFNVSRFWAIFCNLPTFYFIHRWIFGSGLGSIATPFKMTLGLFWTFFWYGRVVYLYIDGGEHSDRLKSIMLGCYFGASTLAFGALKTHDAMIGPILLRTIVSYDEIYAHVSGMIMNKGEFSFHARKLCSDYFAIVVASTFGALYLQSAAKSLAYKKCESIVRESRKMNKAKKSS
jgi:hypothetical protein